MTALAASSTAVKKKVTDGAPLVPSYRWLPVAASQLIYAGALVLEELGTGYAKEATGSALGHGRVVGVARGGADKGYFAVSETDCDNSSGSAADKNVLVEAGVFTFVNDGTSALALKDAGLPCFVVDDATVSADSNCGNRPIAGIFLGLDDDDRAIVAVGAAADAIVIMTVLANADLSSLQYTCIKLVADTGAAEAASSTAGTEVVVGVLLNAPTAGLPARVVKLGPCPLKAAAAGYTAAAPVMPSTAGAAVDATAAKYFVGHALETATSGQSKMVWVQPGVLAA